MMLFGAVVRARWALNLLSVVEPPTATMVVPAAGSCGAALDPLSLRRHPQSEFARGLYVVAGTASSVGSRREVSMTFLSSSRPS